MCGAALIAVGPFAIFYADEARPYATLTALAAVSSLVLLRATRDGGRWWWIAYAASVAAVLYSHYTGVFVVIAQTAWALWFHRERIGGLAAATAGAFVLFLPWLPFVGGKGQLDVYGPFELRLERSRSRCGSSQAIRSSRCATPPARSRSSWPGWPA